MDLFSSDCDPFMKKLFDFVLLPIQVIFALGNYGDWSQNSPDSTILLDGKYFLNCLSINFCWHNA